MREYHKEVVSCGSEIRYASKVLRQNLLSALAILYPLL